MKNYITLSDMHQNQADVLTLLAIRLEWWPTLSDTIKELATMCQNKADIEAKYNEPEPEGNITYHPSGPTAISTEVDSHGCFRIRPESEVKAEAYKEVAKVFWNIPYEVWEAQRLAPKFIPYFLYIVDNLGEGRLPDEKETKPGKTDNQDDQVSFGHSPLG